MRHRLLVVDDERAILMAVGEYFRRRGYEVACARHREEAEALLAQDEYACVIADLRLTAQGTDDGLAIAAYVRERCPGTRVVILTAYGSPAAEKEARLRGVDAFIHKPKPLAEVARVIGQLVGGGAMSEGSMAEDLRREGALSVAFQPIYEVRAERRRLHSLEALVRGPRGTPFESASVLFEYARRTAQEGPVDRACLAAILGAVGSLSSSPDFAVNVHASTLGCDEQLVPFLQELARRHSVTLSRLTVEIVEHAAPCDGRLLAANLDRLRAHGVRIALDDVGIGHSNFAMILDCRPDFLKIDRYLVAGCHADPARQAMIESLARLAPRLGARAVAEGVEDQGDLWTVAALGIDLVQGFLLSRPFFPCEITATGWQALREGLTVPRDPRGCPPELQEVLA